MNPPAIRRRTLLENSPKQRRKGDMRDEHQASVARAPSSANQTSIASAQASGRRELSRRAEPRHARAWRGRRVSHEIRDTPPRFEGMASYDGHQFDPCIS